MAVSGSQRDFVRLLRQLVNNGHGRSSTRGSSFCFVCERTRPPPLS